MGGMAARGIAPEAGSREPTAKAASTEQRNKLNVVEAFQSQSLPLGTSSHQQSCTPNQTAHRLRTKCSNDDGVWYSKHQRGQDGGTIIIPVPEGLEIMSSGQSGLHGDCLKKQTWGPVRWLSWCLPLKPEHQSHSQELTWRWKTSQHGVVTFPCTLRCVRASQPRHIHNNNNKFKRLTLPRC